MMNNIHYRFLKMDLTQFSPDWDHYKPEIPDVGIESNFSFSFNKTQNVLRCTTKLRFSQDSRVFLESELQAFYSIDKESIEGMTNGNELVVPRGLLCQFASLAYGSFRGVLYMKTLNTPMNNLIIPPLYLDEIIKEDVRFAL